MVRNPAAVHRVDGANAHTQYADCSGMPGGRGRVYEVRLLTTGRIATCIQNIQHEIRMCLLGPCTHRTPTLTCTPCPHPHPTPTSALPPQDSDGRGRAGAAVHPPDCRGRRRHCSGAFALTSCRHPHCHGVQRAEAAANPAMQAVALVSSGTADTTGLAVGFAASSALFAYNIKRLLDTSKPRCRDNPRDSPTGWDR
jgi:hypothetical protein